MSTLAEAQITSSSSMEGEDVFMDDQRGDGKKKKFKPFQKMRNFFSSKSSKKRKTDDVDSMGYSRSTGALHNKPGDQDEDDEGGFGRRKGLAGSRSISEDSVFQPEAKEPSIGVLKGQAVSMEAINTGFQAELFSKLRARQSDSDLDEGLPYSPAPLVSPTNYMFRSRTKSEPVPVSPTQDSQQSLISVDGSDGDLFTSNWKSGVASVRTRSSSSGEIEREMNISDFEDVQVQTAHLSNEAAKHRISVKPKSRRLSSKVSMRKKEKPNIQVLSDVKEEPPSPIKVPETKPVKFAEEPATATKPVSAAQQKTVISTTISVGSPPKPGSTVIPARSEPRDIPQPRRPTDESELNKARSLSPVSTSPVSKAALEDVKLRSRPLSGKFEGVELKREPLQADNELSKAFNRAKRFSRKYDGDGNIVDNSGVILKHKETEVKTVSAAKEDTKAPVVSSALPHTTSQMSQSMTSKSSQSTTSPVSPGLTGVSFVLKKEPLRPGTKTPDKAVSAAESHSTTSADPLAKDTKDIEPVRKDINASAQLKVETSDSTGKKGSEEKLASPRDDYRLKRQNRSKTLPVSKELIDKAEDLEGAHKPASRTGSPPLKSMSRSEYDNVIRTPKPVESKRSSWAPASGASSAEPPWMVRSRLKNMEQENQNKEVKKEVKTELKSNTAGNEKVNDKPEKEVKVTEKPPVTSNIKSIIEKNSSASMSRSWAPTQTSKAFDKPAVQSSTKPVEKVSADKVDAAKVTVSSTTKPTVTSQSVTAKPSVTASVKPAVTVASVKPAVSVSSAKPAISVSSAKPTVNVTSSKPTVSSAKSVSSVSSDKAPQNKPTVSSANKPVADRPLSQSVKANTFDNKFSQFGGKVGMQKPAGSTVQPLSQSVKISTQSAGRSTLGTSANTTKTDNTKEPFKASVSSDTKKNIGQENKPGTSFDKPKPAKADTSTSSGVPAWKQALNQRKNTGSNPITQQVKIEIIDKEPEKKVPEKRVEQKAAVEMREKAKAAPEKCSDGNRSSKVLDMVRSFQNLQVT